MLKHIAVVLVATTLAGLAITAGASAQYHHRVHHARPLITHAHVQNTDAIHLALFAAEIYWGRDPACGPIELAYVDSIPPDIPRAQPDSWAFVDPRNPNCTIWLVTSKWLSVLGTMNYPLLCRLIGHEYAHLLDKWDVPEPDTMLSHLISVAVPDPPCDMTTVVMSG